ncbi:uncharacterized protein THITE_2112686 [Thermothielavioides terrestris NRRL 8126]|uniref:Rhodopsin domain-containing protein n=1 Tax=Thermothielavioides terrestris (strain ATCC 38088 / NRRL 8126) TaxID=578455 RepID=G2R000_THETT|nr:uncharacterized protein THITE_2112686 [Thermothielavioides terrestris NRRL 8126]AEO65571.1 hypothetical protein THITE_2112686 [Thermothielavioides terrestris NRRL 8126]
MVVYMPIKDNPRGATILAVLWSMISLSAIFLGLRLYSKLARSRQLWWDDHIIVFSWIVLLVSCSTSTANVRLGLGRHGSEVPLENVATFSIQSNVAAFTSVIAVACSKTSFAITLLRLTDGWMKWFVIAITVIHDLGHAGTAALFLVWCTPWRSPPLPGQCSPSAAVVDYSLYVGAMSAFCDFALALLPWRLLLRFNMYNREKIGVAIAMSMGVVAGISCIVKMTTIPVLNEGDFSYHLLPLILWGFIEPALTIVAASIPMMRHLFKHLHHSFLSRSPSLSGESAALSNDNSNNRPNNHIGNDDNCRRGRQPPPNPVDARDAGTTNRLDGRDRDRARWHYKSRLRPEQQQPEDQQGTDQQQQRQAVGQAGEGNSAPSGPGTERDGEKEKEKEGVYELERFAVLDT